MSSSSNPARKVEEEEEDYLSEAWIQRLEQPAAAKAVKPLVKNRKVDAEDVLQEGLAKPLPQDNVGFKLLAKMGYKPQQSGETIAPMDLVMKRGRTGLGVDEEGRKQAKLVLDAELQNAREREEHEGEIKEQYLKSKGTRFETNRLRGHLIKIRKVRETLRETMGLAPISIDDPNEIALGDDTGNVVDEDENAGDKEEQDEEEPRAPSNFTEPDYAALLQKFVSELRGSPYYYCYWCGARFTDVDDLAKNCPGEKEEDHE